ncbi:hypothetical protein Ocin01_04070 [Orchesella cincta]|uniref:PHD finger protein rhinoceros n=1 Tax=Orchesella cincta TaxID=48709 RepID=A0A1D2NBG8_ORCCI|nr:hypothetical protein Ocin01_04070 [Orchesella cincta]
MCGKRRRRRPSGSDADEDGTRSGSNSGGNGSLTGMWTPRHLNDLKVSSIYNRNSAEAPAEVPKTISLYRKDLISAMKLPDSEPLTPEEYWLITDSWKQEWEKGVQVPVNPESLPEPEVKLITPVADRSHDFRLVTHDDFFNPDYHQLVSTAARAEKVCSYDLDDVDAAWLGSSNADRAMQNLTLISEFLMEQVIEELELQCWEQVQTILKSQEGLGIEYDENVICDVCRSPESEEGNEMVFCDSCNICVHQACYGITTIPSGSWLCRTCTLGIKPTCVLCPNIGGAMKATRSGHTWAHVACCHWIPASKPLDLLRRWSPSPKSLQFLRWSLVCVLCKEKTGACIQCSVKTCKTAYHVTCAFKNGLEMKPIIVDENAEDGIKLRSYCQKHSVNTKKDKPQSGSEEDIEKKKLKAMTAEERNQARAEKLQQIEAEFYKYVRLKDVSQNLAVDMDIVILIFNYWKLKRKSLNNRPLVPPRPETTQLLTQQQEQDLEQMKMFVQLRQDLERVRNLCYMVSRREKLSRSFFRLREQTFQKQLVLLTEKNDLSADDRQAILHANHGPSIYDQFYSHSSSSAGTTKSSLPDYEALISLIAGVDAKKELLVNGVIKSRKSKLFDPSTSAASTSSKPVASTSAAAASNNSSAENNANSNVSTNASSSSASANVNSSTKAVKTTSYLSDSDELELPVVRGKQSAASAAGTVKDVPIYSDSESEDAKPTLTTPTKKETKASKAAAASAAKEKATKKTKFDVQHAAVAATISSAIASKQAAAAAAAEVSPDVKSSKKVKGDNKASPVAPPTTSPKGKGKATGKKGKNKGFDPTELIVPQREAAKKATESIRSVKQKKEQAALDTIEAVATGSTAVTPKEENSPSKDKTKASAASIVSTLSDSDTEEKVFKQPVTKKGEKAKSPERKSSGKGAKKAATISTSAAEEAAGTGDDEFDFDDKDEASAKNVSYVPQRQAAKKAAEHIRSGLSNIVAARLIIEDEMELARKKTKLEKGAKGKSPSRKSDDEEADSESRLAAESAKIETAVAEAAKKVTSKERAPVKGGLGKAGKGKKEGLSSESGDCGLKAAGVSKKLAALRIPDSLLDKGSQSAVKKKTG